jgi:hypothetical protein
MYRNPRILVPPQGPVAQQRAVHASDWIRTACARRGAV